MALPTKDYLQIAADMLRDIANQQPDAYTGADSDFAVRANAVASGIEGLYEHQKWIARQIFADTADSDYLDRHASQHTLTRKIAAFAAGTVRFSGIVASAVPIGTAASTTGGVAYVTTAADVIGAGGTVDIAAQAVLAGLAGNQAASTALALSAAPAGVQSQASIVAMTGGADVESDAGLLARLLAHMQEPPMGGSAHDYYLWAMSVPGVDDAYVFTQRREVNGVDVVIEAAGGLPGAPLIAAVTAYIDTVRPACVNLLVLGPTLVPVNVTAALALSGTTLADATARINSILQTYFSDANMHVGDTVYRARLISMMMDVEGVVDVVMSTPAANVVPLADATHSELATLGVVTLT